MEVKEGKANFGQVTLVIETKEELEVMTDIFGSMGTVATSIIETGDCKLDRRQFTKLNDNSIWEQLNKILVRYEKE